MIGAGGFSRAPSGVAVCVDPDSYLYFSGIEKMPHQETTAIDSENHGFYAAITHAGIQCDVILIAQLRKGAAKGYKALVLPSSMLMDAEAAEILKSHVESGGTVIADAPFATMGRWGRASDIAPNNGLNLLFGLKYDRIHAAISSGTVTSAQNKIPLYPPTESLILHGAQVLGTLENGRPGLVAQTSGKGKTIFFAGRVGAAYLANPDQDNLDNELKKILASAHIDPFIELSPAIAKDLDCSHLMDAKGNLLLVAATQGAKGKMSKEVKDVKMTIPCARPADYKAAFLLMPTRVENGTVRSGPQPLKISADARRISFSIGDVVSAAQVLVIKDTSPLLSVEAAAVLHCGQEANLKVTCYNPSAKSLDGIVSLVLPCGFSDLAHKTKISVGPYGQRTVVLGFHVDADQPVERAPICAKLTSDSVPEGVSSVPIDVKSEK